MRGNRVHASHVLSAKDLEMRTEQNVGDIVTGFLAAAEGLVAHWVEYAKGVLLFVVAPGEERSGAFYIYDRKQGSFWLLDLAGWQPRPAHGVGEGAWIGRTRRKAPR